MAQRGRPKGSNSLVTVTLADLTEKFNDPTQKIVVGKKFADAIGLSGSTDKAGTLVKHAVAKATQNVMVSCDDEDED